MHLPALKHRPWIVENTALSDWAVPRRNVQDDTLRVGQSPPLRRRMWRARKQLQSRQLPLVLPGEPDGSRLRHSSQVRGAPRLIMYFPAFSLFNHSPSARYHCMSVVVCFSWLVLLALLCFALPLSYLVLMAPDWRLQDARDAVGRAVLGPVHLDVVLCGISHAARERSASHVSALPHHGLPDRPLTYDRTASSLIVASFRLTSCSPSPPPGNAKAAVRR